MEGLGEQPASTPASRGSVQESDHGDPTLTAGRMTPPEFPEPPTIEWPELQNIALLRHGTGTSLYTASLRGFEVVVKTPAVGLKSETVFDVVSETCAKNELTWV